MTSTFESQDKTRNTQLLDEIEEKTISQLAADIFDQCSLMEKECQKTQTVLPSLAAGTRTDFWSPSSLELTTARSKALFLLERLSILLQGPHDYLHEFVASNWDHGALYAILQSNTLEHIASSRGSATIGHLSQQSGIPEDKLSRILGLLRCRNIVQMPENGIFTLTAVAEELLFHGDFRAWVEFELFETRVASAHLAEALATRPNEYSNGISGFKSGWGVEMYDWHASHPEKGDRFRRAMKGVSQSLDPANSLIRKSIDRNPLSRRSKVVEIGGRYGFASLSLAPEMSDLEFEVRCDSQSFLSDSKAQLGLESNTRITFTRVSSLFELPPSDDSANVLCYIIRNLFWNWADDEVVRLIQTLLLTLKAAPSTRILVTDGVSPLAHEFLPNVEVGYRRRDVTMMTMHNIKQRTQAEWLELFARVDPSLRITTEFDKSSHVFKGLWELYLGEQR